MRRPAGRAAKGRAQASWQASEDQDDDASGVADEHEFEDGEGSGAGAPQGAVEDAEDSSYKVGCRAVAQGPPRSTGGLG